MKPDDPISRQSYDIDKYNVKFNKTQGRIITPTSPPKPQKNQTPIGNINNNGFYEIPAVRDNT